MPEIVKALVREPETVLDVVSSGPRACWGSGADVLACVFSCRSGTMDYDLVGGEQLHCHFGSILHTTGLQYRDFIHISFHDKVGTAAPHRFSGSRGPSRL